MTELVGREPQYEAPAENYRRHAADGLWNAHLDRPACLELLGDVKGKRVLDAACGPGFYAAELVSRGALVTGFDNSPRMVEFCRQQAGGGEFRVHDLNDPIDWLPDASVDLVLCALAYEYADNRAGALREFRRVLKPGGALVLSKLHPTGDWLRHGGSYFDTRIVEEWWGARAEHARAVLDRAARGRLRGDRGRRVPHRAAGRAAARSRGRRAQPGEARAPVHRAVRLHRVPAAPRLTRPL